MASNEDNGSKPAEEKQGRKKLSSSESKQRSNFHRSQRTSITNNVHVDNAEYLQIGHINTMNVTRHRPYTRSQGKQSCSEVEELTHEQHIRLKQLQDCSEEVDSNMMAELSKSWDRRFSKYGKLLQLDDACLKNIRDRVREDDSVKRREELYQMLLTWKEKTGDPSVKNLIRLLTACGDYSPIKPLLTPSYWTND